MFCRKCGKEIMDDAVFCMYCGCSTQEKQNIAKNTNDAPSFGMATLGFFIPLVGFIIWLVYGNSKPLMAKSAGKGALLFLSYSSLHFFYDWLFSNDNLIILSFKHRYTGHYQSIKHRGASPAF